MDNEQGLGNIRTKKAVLRRQMLAKRRALSADECAEASRKICESFLESSDYKNARSILLYKAYNNEVDTDLIFERARADGKITAYPRSKIVDGEPDLCFYVIEDHGQLTEGYKGIPEPAGDADGALFTERADICITPGVAFDALGHRIGYGRAFYDRYIRLMQPRKVIGFAYDFQMADGFETEDSDAAVDAVITDCAIYER